MAACNERGTAECRFALWLPVSTQERHEFGCASRVCAGYQAWNRTQTRGRGIKNTWKNKKHILDNRKLYKKKVKYADKVFKDYNCYNSPEAGFFLWLKVKDGENFAKQLYSKYAIKVMPGEYLAYGKNNNPGKEYVRVALVHTQIKNNKGLNKIAKLLL